MAWDDNIVPNLVGNYARTAGANAKPYSGIVVHVTGKQTLGDELNWMKTNGQGLGYHYVIDRDGTVYQTAPLDKRMNQVVPDLDKSYNNNNSLGVAMVAGGTPGEEPPPFSPAQLASGKTLIDGLRNQYNIPTNRVVGHGQIQTDREAGNKLNAAGGYEGQDFISYYNKGAPWSDGTAPAAAATAASPTRPGSYGQTGIALLNAELAKRGISPAAASGAIAGLMGESGANLDPTSFNSKDPGGGSGGIGQWNRTRLVGPNGLLAFAQNAGVPGIDVNTPTDSKKVPLAIQAQYLGHELDTTYSGVLNQLKAAKSPQDALGIWVNSYENPADKAGAIAQRSQYLAPVGAALAGGASTAPATPGTTLTSVPAAAGGGGALPGFGTKAASDDFLAGLKKAGITPNQGDQAQSQQPNIQPSPIMSGPGLRNASSPQSIGMQAAQMEPQLTGYSPGMYGQSLNSQPLAWSTNPIGAPSWLQKAGPQQAPGLGTSLNSLQMASGLSPQQLQMMMNPMMLDQGGGYG